jgi:hypothetical protein
MSATSDAKARREERERNKEKWEREFFKLLGVGQKDGNPDQTIFLNLVWSAFNRTKSSSVREVGEFLIDRLSEFCLNQAKGRDEFAEASQGTEATATIQKALDDFKTAVSKLPFFGSMRFHLLINPLMANFSEIRHEADLMMINFQEKASRAPRRSSGRNDGALVSFCYAVEWLTGERNYTAIARLLTLGSRVVRQNAEGWTDGQVRKVVARFKEKHPEDYQETLHQLAYYFPLRANVDQGSPKDAPNNTQSPATDGQDG